jgi:ubiquitin-like 1-activating enzyme E1 B
VESIAGSIIPAVATTNAIVAGLQCLNLKKILRAKVEGKLTGEAVRDIWVQFPRPTAAGYILQPSKPSPPRPDCFACSNNYKVVRISDFSKISVKQFVDETVAGIFGTPEVTVFAGNEIVFDPFEEDEMSAKYDRSLTEWGIESGAILQLEGESLSAQLVVLQEEEVALSPQLIKKPRNK